MVWDGGILVVGPKHPQRAGGSEQGRAWVDLLVLWAADFYPEKDELI